ncbi:MAG: hypothetical protein ACP5N2_00660 [Candidatus Nanoarchaeia archaeon]
MRNFRYGKELLNSLGEVFKKPILLVPFVYLFILNTVFLIMVPKMPVYGPNDPIEFGLIMLILGFGLIQLIIAIVFNAMSLASFRMHLNNEDITCKTQAFQGCKMYWKLFLLRIYQVMIFVIPLVVLFAIYFGVAAINEQVALIIGIILLLVYLIYVVIMLLFFMFSNVIIAYDGKSAGTSLVESHSYFKKNSSHTFFTFFASVIYLLIFVLLVSLISIPFAMNGPAQESIWYDIIVALISIPITAGLILYLFKAFNNGGGEEKTISKQTTKTLAKEQRAATQQKNVVSKKSSVKESKAAENKAKRKSTKKK